MKPNILLCINCKFCQKISVRKDGSKSVFCAKRKIVSDSSRCAHHEHTEHSPWEIELP